MLSKKFAKTLQYNNIKDSDGQSKQFKIKYNKYNKYQIKNGKSKNAV